MEEHNNHSPVQVQSATTLAAASGTWYGWELSRRLNIAPCHVVRCAGCGSHKKHAEMRYYRDCARTWPLAKARPPHGRISPVSVEDCYCSLLRCIYSESPTNKRSTRLSLILLVVFRELFRKGGYIPALSSTSVTVAARHMYHVDLQYTTDACLLFVS